jgi:hypothetical protein
MTAIIPSIWKRIDFHHRDLMAMPPAFPMRPISAENGKSCPDEHFEGC